MSDEHRQDEISKTKKDRVQTSRKVRRIVLVMILVLIGLVLIGVLSGFLYVRAAVSPMDENDDTPIKIEIPSGATISSIGETLEDENLVTNSTFFRYYARYRNFTGFQAGTHELNRTMDIEEIMESLQEGTSAREYELSYLIPEGWWLEDIANTIAEESNHSMEDVMALLDDEEYAEGLVEEYSLLTEDILNEDIRYPLEGYLFPATYGFVEQDTPLNEIVESMLTQTFDVYRGVLQNVDNEEDLGLHEVLTLASIVEREAQTPEDRRLISGVLHNRLDEGMQLEVDPTVAYAQGEHLYMTSLEDTGIDDPYNTYQNSGLPPGPIASPGEDAILSVFEPEDSDYLYFYARVHGEVIYSETFEEHSAVHEEYRDEWIEAREEEESER
ncbi:UPF0755 protein [Geomicrobium halophilum]|uniref:Endolytic murein transglycosylase n=1 Tax=Geomicrobium halophilum TaxID=549000 RepID=A0A841PWZ4_9BACL|nr:endolytic transglycosylase MltG [Geomicrobium halophilum]MBB6448572.1 UPF0755 protein [Geomicrobium halophilum]